MLPILISGFLSGLRTFKRLPTSERALILRAILLVGGIRVALWVLPFRRVRGFLHACERRPLSISRDLPVSRLVWAVSATSRRIPKASCLTQSLALQFLLNRAGHPAQLHIGVSKDPKDGFKAHAWVESEGFTLLSTPSEVLAYSRLLAVEDLSA